MVACPATVLICSASAAVERPPGFLLMAWRQSSSTPANSPLIPMRSSPPAGTSPGFVDQGVDHVERLIAGGRRVEHLVGTATFCR